MLLSGEQSYTFIPLSIKMESIVPLSSGIVFGFALDRGLVSLPYTISSQMEFSNFTMMRMFLGASAMSTLCVLLFDILGIQKRKVKERIGKALINQKNIG